MGVLSNIEPKKVFEHFEAISMVPRRSDHDEQISDYCVQFAKERGLEYVQDAAGNVVIYKGGTPGYEDSEPVILQGHMDMVANKVVGSTHDFDTEPLDLFVDGDLIGAKDTTLGADDGFALAFAMAVLDSDDIPHPPVECVFTVDEENGMSGVEAFDASLLKGRKMFNLDGEDEGIFVVSCAGANICDIVIPVERAAACGTPVAIKITGFKGGHSGGDIQLQRGNANKTMGRILNRMAKKFDFVLSCFDGGSAANVIAQFASAGVVVGADAASDFVAEVNEFGAVIAAEYFGQEPDLSIKAEICGGACGHGEGAVEACGAGEGAEAKGEFQAMTAESTKNVIAFVYGSLDGVQTYDRVIEGAVESSLNAGVVATTENEVRVSYQIRSSVDSKLEEMMDRMGIWCDFTGAYIDMKGSYPAWAYKPESELRPLMARIYMEMYGEEPVILNSHGGLEGGILSGKKPELDIVCMGPNLKDVHTPDERMSIESTQRTWEFFKRVLAELK